MSQNSVFEPSLEIFEAQTLVCSYYKILAPRSGSLRRLIPSRGVNYCYGEDDELRNG